MTTPEAKRPTKAAGKQISPGVARAEEHAGCDRCTGDITPLFKRTASVPTMLRSPLLLAGDQLELDASRHTGLLFSYRSEGTSGHAPPSRYPSRNADLVEIGASDEGSHGAT
jgi:hypothetical protein